MVKDTVFCKKQTINARGILLDLSLPKVMGIINITPDSFYAGSRRQHVDEALASAGRMLSEGAAILDIGACSSRPGAEDISTGEEMDRLLPVLEAVTAAFPDAVISVDTFRAAVAEAAISAGAALINDISGGQLDAAMLATAARLQVPYVLMHMKGNPQTMTKMATYEDVFLEVLDYFIARCAEARQLGLIDIIIDPGFGFAKRQQDSYLLMSRLEELQILGLPVLAGVSRKRMVQHITGRSAEEALNGTTALNMVALMNGAAMLRVHDVREAVEAVNIFLACRRTIR